jgi:hypothetical protein
MERKKPTESEEDRDYYLERRYPFWDPVMLLVLQKKEVMVLS